jgi:aspartate aminotransferase
MPGISKRGAAVPPSPIRKLVPFAEEAKNRGLTVYHLNIGQPDVETPKTFWDAVHSYPSKVLSYGRSQGDSDYIKVLAKYYQNAGIPAEEKNILVTAGGSEAIVFAMTATTDPGDNLIVFEPFYTNYNGYAAMCDITLKPVTSPPENGYHLPPVEVIEKAIDDKTKGIIICTPNNPTGTVLTEKKWKSLPQSPRSLIYTL